VAVTAAALSPLGRVFQEIEPKANSGCWGAEFKLSENPKISELRPSSYNRVPPSFSTGLYVPASGPDPVRTTLLEDKLVPGGLIVNVPVKTPVTPSENAKLVFAS
jgi:hypothetical protein